MKKFKVTFITTSGVFEAAYVRAADYTQCHFSGLYDSTGIPVMVNNVIKVELCTVMKEREIMDQTGDEI